MERGPRAEPTELEAAAHRALSHVARIRITQMLRTRAHSVVELAAATRLHPNTVRSHLDVLLRAGLVERRRDETGRPGRPPILFHLVQPPAPGPHELLAGVLATALAASGADAAAAAEQAARPWGHTLTAGEPGASTAQAVDRVVAELDALGFAPEVRADGDEVQVLLRHCPFDDLARTFGDVICAVHLGLVKGALQGLGVAVHADLQPYVEPTLCLLQLSDRPDSGDGVPPSSA